MIKRQNLHDIAVTLLNNTWEKTGVLSGNMLPKYADLSRAADFYAESFRNWVAID